MTIDKTKLLTENKSFCMLPWVHIHVTPYGRTAPCCIGQSIWGTDNFVDADDRTLNELVNCNKMKSLRLNMLEGTLNPECSSCHKAEEVGVQSFRQQMNIDYAECLDEVIDSTQEDGTVSDFKLRYFDARFSNICNFKCRTCCQDWSSQWEQENKVHNIKVYKANPKYNSTKLLEDTIDQIKNMKVAYFAGGEPLITEEHYILLEEMIRQERTDIVLKYNTNFSNLNFKDKDLLNLWSNFSHNIWVNASIDHYGERAEYIRTGTNWGEVEDNLKLAAQMPYISLRLTTLLNAFNFLTIDKFYEYCIDKQLFNVKDPFSINYMNNPSYLSCNILPREYKEKGLESINNSIKLLENQNYMPENIGEINKWVDFNDPLIWMKARRDFKVEINRLDKIRDTSFRTTFPELAPLLDM